MFDFQGPRVFVIMGHAHSIIVGDHVVVNGQNGLWIGFDPSNLKGLDI